MTWIREVIIFFNHYRYYHMTHIWWSDNTQVLSCDPNMVKWYDLSTFPCVWYTNVEMQIIFKHIQEMINVLYIIILKILKRCLKNLLVVIQIQVRDIFVLVPARGLFLGFIIWPEFGSDNHFHTDIIIWPINGEVIILRYYHTTQIWWSDNIFQPFLGYDTLILKCKLFLNIFNKWLKIYYSYF